MLTLEWLSKLWETHQACTREVATFSVSERFEFGGANPVLMGVVNRSAQSWYRESVCLNTESAVRRGRVLTAQGADFIDVGGESTLAHADRVDDAAQIESLCPIIAELARDEICVSIETYSPAVAQAGLDAGARIVNLTGTQSSDAIYQIAAQHDAAVIISYVQGAHVRAVGDLQFSGDPIDAYRDYFQREIACAKRHSLAKLIIDPGMGFYYPNLDDGASRVQYQMRALLESFRLQTLGFPICHALPHAFEYFGEEVRTAEPYFAVLAALGQTHVYRTHEVAKVRAVLQALQQFNPNDLTDTPHP